MSKKFILKYWYLELAGSNIVIAHGHCYNNPRFLNGSYIHTSTIVDLEINDKEECIDIYTLSGSHYVLKFNEMDIDYYNFTKEVIKYKNIPLDIKRCKALVIERVNKEEQKISDMLKSCEIYIELGKKFIVKRAYYKTKKGKLISITLADNWAGGILKYIETIEGEKCYLRIEIADDRRNAIIGQTSKINAIYINNTSTRFTIFDINRDIECKSNKTTRIEPKKS